MSFVPFSETVLVYFEAEFDSNYRILRNIKADLWPLNPQCIMIKNKWKSVVVSILGCVCYAEGMKMYSFIGNECESRITVQFSGLRLVDRRYHRPNQRQ